MVERVKKTKRKEILVEKSPLEKPLEPLESPPIVRYGVGFDVHKTTIATCVKAQLQTGELVEVRTHVFAYTPQGLEELMHYLQRFRPISHYLMECTGVYHLPLYFKLQLTFPNDNAQIIAMNPLLIHRRLSDFGLKTDKADAASIANLTFYDRLIKPSYIGSSQYMQLRETLRSYHHAQQHCTRLKNRIHRNLHAVNQQFPFDFTKEWCLKLLDRYISQEFI
jgi:transposase